MNAEPASQAAVVAGAEIETVRARHLLASFNLIFVMTTASLIYFGVASGPAADLARMNGDLILISIRILCVVSVVTAACACLYSWIRLLRL